MTPRPRRLLGAWLAALAVIAVTIPARAGSFCPAGTRQRDGELHGSRRTWCETRDGVAHGPFAVWHPGGVLALAGWREGDLVLGTLTTWYADGMGPLRQEQQTNGLQDVAMVFLSGS